MTRWIRGFAYLTWIEAKLFIREWQAIFFTFIFWPMLLFIVGAIAQNDPSLVEGRFGLVDLLVPAFIGIGILNNGLFTIGGLLASYRERGILRRFEATPLRPAVVLAALVFVAYLMTLVSTGMILGVSKLFFNLRLAGQMTELFLAFTVGALGLFAFGFLVGSLFQTSRVTYAVCSTLFFSMIPFAIIPLGGTLFNPDLIPPFMQTIAHIVPLTYVVELIHDVFVGHQLLASWPDLLILIALFGLFTVLSARLFRWE